MEDNKKNEANKTELKKEHVINKTELLSGEYKIESVGDDTVDTQEREISSEEQLSSEGSRSRSKAVVALALLIMLFVALVVFLFSGLSYFAGWLGERSDSSVSTEPSSTVTVNASDTHSDDSHFSIEEAARLPDREDQKALSTVEIAALVGPATVSIEADVQFGFPQDEQFVSTSGSGFIISEDGYIVTNRHVISTAERVRAVIPGYEESFDATVVGFDDRTDIAVLKIDVDEPLPYVILGDSDLLMPGELAVAIGNPFGELAGTVTVGVISAINRTVSFDGESFTLIQTDASVNTGNSGGPLLNSFGEVVGVTNAKISTGEGLGFAIPINTVRDIIEEIIEQGYVSGRPIMGVVVVAVDYVASEAYGWPIGVYVRDVTENGPAEKAGLQSGDIITRMNDQSVTTTNDVLHIRNALEVGDEIIIEAYRNGEVYTFTMVLEEGSIS